MAELKRNKACDQCRKAHVKCDGKPQCSNCIMRSRQCTYSLISTQRRKPSKKDIATKQEILKLSSQIQQLKQSEQFWQHKYNQLKHQIDSSSDKQDIKRRKIQKPNIMNDNRLVLSVMLYSNIQRQAFTRDILPEKVVLEIVYLYYSLNVKFQI